MSATDRDLRSDLLAWIEAREKEAAEATAGPWRVLGKGKDTVAAGRIDKEGIGSSWYLADMLRVNGLAQSQSDARFIASARTALPLALKALRAVVELHEGVMDFCDHCGADGTGSPTQWPCPTLRRLHAALIGEK